MGVYRLGAVRKLVRVEADRPRRKSHRIWRSLALKALALLLLIGVWQALSLFYPPTFLPGPLPTFARVGTLIANGSLLEQATPTVLRVLAGFLLALLVGTAVGIAMGSRNGLEGFFESYILVGLTVPGFAWAILALMWFGVSEAAPVFAIFAVVTPMLAVNMWQGTKAIDRQLLEMAKVFHVGFPAVLTGIILPQLMPYLLAGSRFGFALGWKVVVLSEAFGLSSGIGYQINRSFSLYSMRDVLAWTIGFTLVMFLLEYGVLLPAERRLLRWRTPLSHGA